MEIEPVMPQRKGTGLRAAAAFLTFFMGVSLTLGSLFLGIVCFFSFG